MLVGLALADGLTQVAPQLHADGVWLGTGVARVLSPVGFGIGGGGGAVVR